jgi:nitrous oxidase accessory protein NosD
MSLKASPILALVCLLPLSNFEAVRSVSPDEGGKGIQAALDSLPFGGEVVLGAGTYLVREPIRVRKDGQTLRGCGPTTVLYLADEANCPVVILGSISAYAKHSVKGVRLEELAIDGNRKHQQKEVWRFLPEGAGVYNNGVEVWGAEEASVEHVVCSHCRSGGLVSSARTRRLTVRDYVAFDNQFDGLACYDTEDSQFSQLNLHDNLAAGISLDLSFNHNVIRDAILTNDDLGIFMRQSRDNVFERVTIKQSRHHGVFMAEAGVRTTAGWRLVPGSECSGNTFRKLLITDCGGSAFRVNDAGCTNNAVYGGQFVDNAQGGLSEVASNLLTISPLKAPSTSLPSEAAPVVHKLTQEAGGRVPNRAF